MPRYSVDNIFTLSYSCPISYRSLGWALEVISGLSSISIVYSTHITSLPRNVPYNGLFYVSLKLSVTFSPYSDWQAAPAEYVGFG